MDADVVGLVSSLIGVLWIVPVLTFVLMAAGLYTIAKKRNLLHPWMAWCPVLRLWLLGSICDHYNQTAKGKKSNHKTRMLILKILSGVLKIVIGILGFLLGIYASAAMLVGAKVVFMEIFSSVPEFVSPEAVSNVGKDLDTLVSTIEGLVAAMIGLVCTIFAAKLWLSIETFVAYHGLFASCDPAKKKALTAWSVVTTCLGLPIVASILIFTCRNKAAGLLPATPSGTAYQGYQVPEKE